LGGRGGGGSEGGGGRKGVLEGRGGGGGGSTASGSADRPGKINAGRERPNPKTEKEKRERTEKKTFYVGFNSVCRKTNKGGGKEAWEAKGSKGGQKEGREAKTRVRGDICDSLKIWERPKRKRQRREKKKVECGLNKDLGFP